MPPATVAGALATATARLAAAGIDAAPREARLLVGHALGLDAAALVRDPARPLDGAAGTALAALLARRLAREPMAYILGRREFWSLELGVADGVLIPRPDSETVVEAVLARAPDRGRAWRILDLGTGSGCLLLALLSEFPEAIGVGVDRAPRAVAIAAENARRLGLDRRCRFVRGDWARALAGPFDIVVANPPYIRRGEIDALAPEVARFEPRAALDGGADGLAAYRALVPDLGRLLGPGGFAALEHGADQAVAVAAIVREAGLEVFEILRDLAGRTRGAVVGPRPPRAG
ncbi:MAG: peptide chain release factor N(5)-glutamine methyltransferase [Alphaproteobacteria bacterium]|nr:peptide chain release factor N(5)-glutamine methyltransferase [Alphaproteobacteria bacterium]